MDGVDGRRRIEMVCVRLGMREVLLNHRFTGNLTLIRRAALPLMEADIDEQHVIMK